MAFQEIKTMGYGSRVGGSFSSIGIGIILFLAGTALLWWNEGRAVKAEKMLEEAGSAYVEMENPNKKDTSLDGELICGTAMATTEDSLSDHQFGVGAKAIALKRRVEYYQWVEHASNSSEDKMGGSQETTTTYTYSLEWVPSPVQSSEFKDPAYQRKNMVLATYEDTEQYAENVSWGAYQLSESLIRCISSREELELSIPENLLKQLDQSTQVAYERFYGMQMNNQPAQQPVQQQALIDSVRALLSDSAKAVLDSLQAVNDSIKKQMESANNKKDLKYIHQAGNVLYFGRVPTSPEAGDVRITFEIVVPAKVTVMAVVDGDTFKPYKAKNGKRFQTLVMGKKSGDEIIEEEEEINNMFLWFLRIVGALMVIGGLKGIFNFITSILMVIPFVANIIGWGIGIVCTVVGIAWSLIIIAIAWLFYRPLLGISLLVLAGFLVWVFAFKGKEKLKELAANARNKNVTQTPESV